MLLKISISGPVCALLLGCFAVCSKAQSPVSNKPTAGVVRTPDPTSGKSPKTAPVVYSGVSVNYVRTREAVAPVGDEDFDGKDYHQVKQTTQYIDGLGRPLQTVVRQATPGSNPRDIVMPVTYDGYGREVFKYLPYVQTTTSTDDGSFKLNPFTEQTNFYSNVYKDANGNAMYSGEKFFYSETQFEPSPLNRIKKAMAPGNSWVGNNIGVEQQYLVNTQQGDDVKIWNIPIVPLNYNNTNQDADINIPVSSPVSFLDGQLYKSVSIDEQGSAVVEYKDKQGQVILKKVQIGSLAIPGDYSGYQNFLCTYYVYDDLNRLRFVIPPKAVEAIKNDWTLSLKTDVINELCFRYEYDARQRMIAKKVPGAGWVYMVYDQRDRLVFTQDANMRARNQWMATIYDVLNRPVTTGILSYSQGREALQAYLNGITSFAGGNISVSGGVPSANVINMVLPKREIGRLIYHSSNSITFEIGFESEAGADLTAEILPGISEPPFTNVVAVSTNPLPSTDFIPLTVTHYDNYTDASKPYTNTYNSKLDVTADNNIFPDLLPSSADEQTTGMVTWSKVRVLENPDDLASGLWLSTVVFYDNKARPVQTQSDNYKGGTDIVINHYDFAGKVLSNYMVHNNPQAVTDQQVKVKTTMTYDHMGRVLQVSKTLNDLDSKATLIAKNEYDEMGQLKTKQLGQKRNQDGSYAVSPLETLDYSYNVRGWLKGINAAYAHPELNAGSGQDRWFGMELNYDWGSETNRNQLNGNISSTTWKSKGDGQRRAYGFTYDMANRLLGADFSEYSGSGYTDNQKINFDIVMGDGVSAASAYDENGNIRAMKQWGVKLTKSDVIDDLIYTYGKSTTVSSNKLLNVIDKSNDPSTTLGDFRTANAQQQGYKDAYVSNPSSTNASTITDYGYDDNGNLTTDKNKNISSITYNHLNLPWKITVKKDDGSTDKGIITYIYDAAGSKLEKRVQDNTTTTATTKATTYIGAMVYEQNSLQFISHEEGRTRINTENSNTTFNNDYFIKDHLGNVRMVLTDERQTAVYPAATLEGSLDNTSDAVYVEKSYYNINPAFVALKSDATGIPDYPNNNAVPNNNPNSNSSANSQKLYKLNSNTNKVGLGITLKVMAGDEINIYGKSYYFNIANVQPGPSVPVGDLLDMFVGGSGLVGKGLSSSQLTADVPGLLGAVGDFIGQHGSAATTPKAYINWMFFDEQFRYVGGSFDPVNGTPGMKDHNIPNIAAPKNGYVFVYCSNESPVDVFFDNLQVTHTKGPLLEETHYYPFGLTMAGISSKAMGGVENKRGFNGGNELQSNEFSDGSGLELYDAANRMYDPQLGRFGQIDKLADVLFNYSPYLFGNNNPVLYNDPLGLLSTPDHPEVLQEVVVTARRSNPLNNLNYASTAAWVDKQRGNGFSNNQINSFLDRQHLNNGARDKFNDAMSQAATNIREAEDEYKDAQAEVAEMIALGMIPVGEIGGLVGTVGSRVINAIAKSGGEVLIEAAAKGAGRVFWSGGGNEAVEVAARKFATEKGMTTLEMTRAGKNLMNLTQGMSWAEKGPMWQKLSSQFAKGANETVHVFHNAGGIGVKSTWGTVEFPILQSKGINIIYHIVP